MISFTKHAEIKMNQRGICKERVIKVLKDPSVKEVDKLDLSLVHYIKYFKGRYLRVIGRWQNYNDFLVITVFYDRRLKQDGEND